MYEGNPGEIDFGSSYREMNYSKCMTEIQEKSTLVRVNARFELAKVRVIGSLMQITGSRKISRWMGRECSARLD